MKILFAASEAVPFCKTGGLADVAGSLPQALAQAGNEVSVILPLYQQVGETWRERMTFVCQIQVPLSWRHLHCGLFRLEKEGLTWYFIDNETYFMRDALYGHPDDGERFAFFSRAIVALLPYLDGLPQIIHCNDWQTALIPMYLRDKCARSPEFDGIKTVLTIHNIEYQGRFGRETLGDLFGLDDGWYSDSTIEMDGDVNLLKGALMVCDAITTVSPTYAQELHHAYYAHGMDPVIALNSGKLCGILNGIDMARYDPSADPDLPHRYSPAQPAGKQLDKVALQRELGLRENPDTPLIAIVSRLVGHKGLDLVCQVFPQIMELNCQFVILGCGDTQYEQFFAGQLPQYPERMALHLGYDEKLAMRIYAGADLMLMPSKSEPCGLAQLIAMRYGAVPIVRETGGLKDTVHPYESWRGAGNGFTFANYNSGDMLYVIRQAVDLYFNHPSAFKGLRRAGMSEDFSWTRSAAAYQAVYQSLCP